VVEDRPRYEPRGEVLVHHHLDDVGRNVLDDALAVLNDAPGVPEGDGAGSEPDNVREQRVCRPRTVGPCGGELVWTVVVRSAGLDGRCNPAVAGDRDGTSSTQDLTAVFAKSFWAGPSEAKSGKVPAARQFVVVTG
jgi:hypothetical protein